MEINFDTLFDVSRSQRPRMMFEVGADVLPAIRNMMDGNQRYVWNPGMRDGDPGTLLGYEIRIVPGDALRLITVVTDKTNIVNASDL